MPIAIFDGTPGEHPEEEHFLSETEKGHQTPMHIQPSFVCGCGDIPALVQQNTMEGWTLLACRNTHCQAKDIEKVIFWPRSQYRIPSELGVAEFRRCPSLLKYLVSLGRIHPHQQTIEHAPPARDPGNPKDPRNQPLPTLAGGPTKGELPPSTDSK